jgi:YD repeat-containing protein
MANLPRCNSIWPSYLLLGGIQALGCKGTASDFQTSPVCVIAKHGGKTCRSPRAKEYRNQSNRDLKEHAVVSLSLNYYSCPCNRTSCATNNGNLQSSGRAVPLNVTQAFGYDKVNRLTSAQETGGGSSEWNQTYTYDQWGNRAVSGNYIPNAYATPAALTQYSNNQWLGTEASYDNNGNQNSLPSRAFTYDAENRLITSTQPGMGAISYAYDGQGHRVQKTVGSTVTSYVYDASGQLTAEYGASPAAARTSGSD